MRVLHHSVSDSPFLRDLAPAVVDLIIDTWPLPSEYGLGTQLARHSNTDRTTSKGKGTTSNMDNELTARLTSARIVAASLDLVRLYIEQPVSSFEDPSRKMFMARIACEELRAQLLYALERERMRNDDDDEADGGLDDRYGSAEVIDINRQRQDALAIVWGYLWRMYFDLEGLEGDNSFGLASLLDLEMSQGVDEIIEQLMTRETGDNEGLSVSSDGPMQATCPILT